MRTRFVALEDFVRQELLVRRNVDVAIIMAKILRNGKMETILTLVADITGMERMEEFIL